MVHLLTKKLLEHRAAGTRVEFLEESGVPQSLEEAYGIQAELISSLGGTGAWKVQPFPATGMPLASPILAHNVHRTSADLKLADYPAIGVEAEIAVGLASDLVRKHGDYSADELRGAIGSLHLAIEVISSRYLAKNTVSPLAEVADLQNNGAVVVGGPLNDGEWPELGRQALSLLVDGVQLGSTSGNATTENVLLSLAWLATHAAGRGMPLKRGDYVITGARIGSFPLTGNRVEVRGHRFPSVTATFW